MTGQYRWFPMLAICVAQAHPQTPQTSHHGLPHDPSVRAGSLFYRSLQAYTLNVNHQIVPRFDTVTPWKAIFETKKGAKAIATSIDDLEQFVSSEHLRIRINPAIVGKKLPSLSDSTLFLEIYFEGGSPAGGVAVDGWQEPLPPLNTPLDKDGYPAPFRLRYRDFHARMNMAREVPSLSKSDELSVSSGQDRLWLLSQFSDLIYGDALLDKTDIRIELVLANHDRYLVDSNGVLRLPSGRTPC